MSFFFLPAPLHDDTNLPVPATQHRRRSADVQIVCEFRAKLRMAEEMISKLAFSLNEIQGTRRETKKPRRARVARSLAAVTELVRR